MLALALGAVALSTRPRLRPASLGLAAGIALTLGLLAWSLSQWGGCASELPDGTLVEHDCGSPPSGASGRQ